MSSGASVDALSDATTNVSIYDTETTTENNKKFTVYKVMVSSEGRTWFIFRRYNEFHMLYDKMKKLYPDAHLKLPGRKIFGSLDPDFIKHRREGLHDFIQKMIDHPDMSQHPDVGVFLNIKEARKDDNAAEDDDKDSSQDSASQASDNGDSNSVNLGPTEKKHVRPSDFEFMEVVGQGSFGKVLKAKHKVETKIYAVKVLKKQYIMKRNEVTHILAERNVLVKSIKHPFLVRIHYSFQTATKLYFVLDYVNGGEMFYHLQRERCFPEPRARFYAAEIASALGYLHGLNTIYRDLKPENILLDSEGHIVLTDFGLAKEGIQGLDTTSTFCGTPEYLAPEVLRKQPYDRTVDWWCLGAVLYEMLYGLPPFYSKNTSEMYDRILHSPLNFRGSVSSAAKNILEGMLHKEKDQRLGVKNDFLDIKCHPFFAPINWTHLEERKIKPPYKPDVSGPADSRMISEEFTDLDVPESVGRSGGSGSLNVSVSVQEADHVCWGGFSYAAPDEDAFN